MSATEGPASVNRAHWDALAEVHSSGTSSYYDLDALANGASSLSAVERAGVARAVGDVAGKDVLHLQCHLGMDAVSLARMGARVTGVDFSATALDQARAVAERCGVDVEFVQADATDLPPALHGRFDLVYATIGILTWIEDLDAWMRSARGALRPEGRLLLVDVHPLFSMFASLDPLEADFPYASAGPVSLDDPGSYADATAAVSATATVEFAHSLGEIVTASVGAGLQVERVDEHLDCEFDPRGVLTAEPDGLFRFRLGGLPVPMLYSLIAAA